jgi:uncharacterized membrane protein HdeD (DUF308 family)
VRKATVNAESGRPAVRTWSVLATRAVLVMIVVIIAFVNPVVALAISVAFFAIYKMLDANAFNRHRGGEPRSDGSKER